MSAVNPDLPCAKVDGLPCIGPTGLCMGPIQWEFRSYKEGERAKMDRSKMKVCPYVEQARAWWKRNMRGVS